MLDVGPAFAECLKQGRYSANSIRSYRQNAGRLLHRAEMLGWGAATPAVLEGWRPILAAFKKIRGAPRGIVRFAIRNGKAPSEFCEADLKAWGDWMERYGRKQRTVRILKGRFRRTMARLGCESLLPKFNCHPQPSEYRIRTSDMPEPLRTEIVALLQWKQARFSKGRPQRGRHRAASARELESWINRLYGFAKNVARFPDIRTLLDLVNENVVGSFAEWALNERKLSRSSMLRLSMIYAAVRHYPSYKNENFDWFSEIFSQLPEDQDAVRLEKKAAKYVPYDVLCTVPNRIRDGRLKKKCDTWHAAWLVHCELLITWLVTLPWRQRNIRECRLRQPETANVFYSPLPALLHMAKPKWVEDALCANPNECFWQFHFRVDETKTGHTVRGILPRRLLPLLEDYLENHRPNSFSNARLIASCDMPESRCGLGLCSSLMKMSLALPPKPCTHRAEP